MKKKLKRMCMLFLGIMLMICIPMQASATALEQETAETSEDESNHDSEISLTSEEQEPEFSRAAEDSRGGQMSHLLQQMLTVQRELTELP